MTRLFARIFDTKIIDYRSPNAQDVFAVVTDTDLLSLRLLHSCSLPATSSGL